MVQFNKVIFKGSNFFRQRLVLSILSGKTIYIEDIRNEEDKPGLKGKNLNNSKLISINQNNLYKIIYVI